MSAPAGPATGDPDDEWVLAGRYRVDAPIGSGGMGEVWRGYDRQLDRRVAIKLMHRQQTVPATGSAESDALAQAAALDRERFLREIRTTARLELPGVPAVYDFGVEDSTGRLYLVMQLLYGQTLAEIITAHDGPVRALPASWVAATAAQVAATLVEVHRVDVVHRDIKPSNLMVVGGGLVKVLDFGVAILQGAAALPKLTQLGMTVGSPPYMPPEQVLGNPVGPASDVYALGCVLHEMLTGRTPFLESPSRSYRDHHVNTAPPSTRALRPDVPSELDALIRAMLAKAPGDRPGAEAVYDALLPLARSRDDAVETEIDADGDGVERDPRRPFRRPLAPTPSPRARATRAPAAPRPRPTEPLTFDEAMAARERAADLLQDGQSQQAIDILDDAVARVGHEPALELELRMMLATTLYLADEFGRAAAEFDAVLPEFGDHPDADIMRYYAGISHAEIGEIEPAIGYLSDFLSRADPSDPLHRDATYRLGIMLPVVGRAAEGLRHLESLRPLFVAEYGDDSVHVHSLDRRIAQVRDRAGVE